MMMCDVMCFVGWGQESCDMDERMWDALGLGIRRCKSLRVLNISGTDCREAGYNSILGAFLKTHDDNEDRGGEGGNDVCHLECFSSWRNRMSTLNVVQFCDILKMMWFESLHELNLSDNGLCDEKGERSFVVVCFVCGCCCCCCGRMSVTFLFCCCTTAGYFLVVEGVVYTTRLGRLVLKDNKLGRRTMLAMLEWKFAERKCMYHMDLRNNRIPGDVGKELIERVTMHRRYMRKMSLRLEDNLFDFQRIRKAVKRSVEGTF